MLYDEHGGFYDHFVPPACAAPGDTFLDDTNRHGFAFDRPDHLMDILDQPFPGLGQRSPADFEREWEAVQVRSA